MSYTDFISAISAAKRSLLTAGTVKSGYWQGIDTKNRPEMATHELINYTVSLVSTDLPKETLVFQIKPDVPWADDHFAERVSREPLNPPPSESWWPYAPKGNQQFKSKDGKFSHTYPERYWPKFAGRILSGGFPGASSPEGSDLGMGTATITPNRGIRFEYGDLNDLVTLLLQDPYTRQAYLPVWFPEDLGAPITERKPCSLGYHFIMRDNQLHIVYYIRSCDFYRHFKNDIYLTVLLQHWVLNELKNQDLGWNHVVPGSFTMHITSLHLFVNDYRQLLETK